MKTLDFVSILVLAAATTFACDDDGDRRVTRGTAGSGGSLAGDAGKTSMAGTTSEAGAGGASAGASGNAGETSEGGASGAAGSNEGGVGEGGEGGAAGSGIVGGAAGESGAGGQAGGGGEAGTGAVQGPLEIIGSWDNNFGGEDIITATEWSSFGAPSNIVEYENDANVVYTESGGTFSKIVYTDVETDSFYYCTIEYGKATLAEAIASTKVADSSDPDASGCGSFSWTKNTRQ